ncbi:O-antigen membrane protein [Ignavibacterium album JCM 16511]|uniref:O-antigen membrane protein n=1 Tax=Ignavibacterium album (strain DSM 19864 / JCM 16511 / NBRC 101810 / Mat9-16) TaxID=945713 RepID=I0AP66_IGNAJ|nr:MATE family efflux transporter [Ignavibacterium album]AFH50773.1 O-antigen membrane protein [Ignavibacterium album JCM 16511]
MNINFNIKELLRIGTGSRTEKAKKNIVVLFIIHIFNFIALMALVPVTIKYLGENQYGIWLTLSSVFMWLGNLDFGIGNGLRNKLAESFAKEDFQSAKKYLSTAYTVFAIGIFSSLIIYLVIHPFINWVFILNAGNFDIRSLNNFVLIVFVFFAFQFLLRLLTSLINADQKPALNGFITLCINVSTLAVVFILYFVSDSSLYFYGFTISLVPFAVLLIASFILFKGRYKKIAPSFKYIDLKSSRSLVSLGMQFFVIQIAALIVFATDNLIITHLYDPSQVTVYNIAHKYFFFVTLVFNVFLSPFWSAFTDAFVKRDFEWIKQVIKRLVQVWALLSVGTIIMILFSDFVYSVWIGNEIKIPFSLSVAMGIFMIVSNWNNIFAFFLNGIGKIRLQFYYSIFAAVINIPLSIILAKEMKMGITGVITATIICIGFASLWAPIQYKKIITETAKGIWNR